MAPLKTAPMEDSPDDLESEKVELEEHLKGHLQLYEEAIEKLENSEFSRLTRSNVEAVFKVFDLDTNGYISMNEIKERFESNVDNPDVLDHLQQICAQADSSGDGLIDIEEFYQALCLNVDADPFKRILRGAEQKKDVWAKRDDIIDFLKQREEILSSCQSLPFYIVFFALAFVLVVFHLQVEEIHNSLDSVRNSFAALDVDVLEWAGLEEPVFDWLAGGFLDAANFDDARFPGRIHKYSQIIGGVKLKKSTAEADECLNPTLDGYFDMQGSVQAANNQMNLTICQSSDDTAAQEVEWLLATHGAEKIQELRDKSWIDRRTTTLVMTFFTYNAHSGFYVVAKLTFERTKFGGVSFSSRYESFNADPYNSVFPQAAMLACDITFIAMIAWMAFSELSEVVPQIRRNGFRKGSAMYWSVWNAIDWFNIVCSAVICIVYYVTVTGVWAMNELVQSIPVTNLAQCIATPSSCTTKMESGESVLDVLDASIVQANLVGFFYYSLRGITVFFAFSTMLAFFKAFRANPRLRVVTDTIVMAKQEFVHFLVVFASIFFVFVLSGYILFGNQVKQFRSAGVTIDTCAMMMLGFVLDDIRGPMQDAFPVLGVMWIWFFYIVLAILLFNMILAIIFDVYGDVKNKAGEADTIFQQGRELFQQKKAGLLSAKQKVRSATTIGSIGGVQNKVWTDTEILRFLVERNYHSGDVVTPSSLIVAFGKTMGKERSKRLLDEVDGELRHVKMAPEITTEDILRLLGRVDHNVRDLRSDYHRDKQAMNKLQQKIPASKDTTGITARGAQNHAPGTQDEYGKPAVPMPMGGFSPTGARPTEMEGVRGVSAKEVAILGAKIKRLESYTAHRMDMIEDKCDFMLSKLERLLPEDPPGGGDDHILRVLDDMRPSEDDYEMHE